MTVGLQLGNYKIEAMIGQGGMGQVFRATDTKLRAHPPKEGFMDFWKAGWEKRDSYAE